MASWASWHTYSQKKLEHKQRKNLEHLWCAFIFFILRLSLCALTFSVDKCPLNELIIRMRLFSLETG